MDKELILIICLVIVCLALVIFIINNMLLRKTINENQIKQNKELSEMNEKVNGYLNQFQNQLSNNMKDDFSRLNESTINRLINIEEKVNSSMTKSLVSTNESFMKIMESITKIDSTQKNLENLSTSINSLQSILNDKKSRGTYGEVELYSLLENQFGLDTSFYAKQKQLSNGRIADAVIFAPNPLNMICIDSKFPLENYNRMYDSKLSKEEQEHYRRLFRNDVITKVKDIASKYIINDETADFAYMFIPAEAVFSEICARFDDILNLSYNAHVYLVSPTTLMAYLTAMRAIYLGQKKNEKIHEIQLEFNRLGKEFERFESRYEKTMNDFNRTHNDMQELAITTGKMIKRFKEIEQVKLESKEIE